MDLIFGGAYQGKLDYAKKEFQIQEVFTCRTEKAELDFSKDAVYKLEDFVLACLREGSEAKEYLQAHREAWRGQVFICTDISQGIVPADPEARALREMTGRAMIYLAAEADTVTRVFCGLGQRIKGGLESYIYLIRHGITEANQKRLYYGASDVPLSEEGAGQLKKLAADGLYPAIESGDFYTTGLLRTEQTLPLIFGRRNHSVIRELREMDFGIFEMKGHEELKNDPAYLAWVADKSRAMSSPGGESILEFHTRVSRGFDLLREKHNQQEAAGKTEAVSVAICHGGTIAVIMEQCFPGEQENFYRWIPDPGHGYRLILKGGKPKRYESF